MVVCYRGLTMKFGILLLALSVTGCSSMQSNQFDNTPQFDPNYGARFITPINQEASLSPEERMVNRLRLELLSSFSNLSSDIRSMVKEQVLLAFENHSSEGSMLASTDAKCSPYDEGELKKAGIIYNEKTRKQISDDDYKKRSAIYKKNVSVDVIMRLNSRVAQRYWWTQLDDHGIKDKFKSQNMGEYLIYLGHFNNYDQANKRLQQITDKIGDNLVELVVSKQTNI